MKKSLLLFAYLHFSQVFAQHTFPDFLKGTWRIEESANYEHWDQLSSTALHGFSYTLESGEMHVTEYIALQKKGTNTVYTATVIGQNKGEGISFKQKKNDSAYIFENRSHDFPKRIVYQKISDQKVNVTLTDGKQKTISYSMYQFPLDSKRIDSTVANPNYDPTLANALGADDYGMKSYVFVILKTGSNSLDDQAQSNALFSGHLKNIHRLVEEGKLVVAGPFGSNDDHFRGLFILNVTDFEEATKLLNTDPAIESGLLAYDLYPWYGSAALTEYLKSSDKIWKVKP